MAAVSILTPAAQAQGIETIGEVAGWDIIIDPSVGLGCAMQAEFEGGALVRMGFNPADGNGYIMVLDEDWTDIVANKKYDIGMKLDKESYVGKANGFLLAGVPGVIIPFDNEELFLDIMKKHTLTLTHEGHEAVSLSLDGTYKALEGVMACQEGVNSAAK